MKIGHLADQAPTVWPLWKSMMRSTKNLTRLLSQSGFPLQMAIDRLITDDSESLGWKILSREHGWATEAGRSGFIDLVVEDRWQSSVLALECKRVLDSDWLFLLDAKEDRPTRSARLWITNTQGHGLEYCGYFDVRTEPESAVSMFCVVPGQDPKSRPMLERTAAELAAATEALALEKQPYVVKKKHGIRMYGSVIVTTARLVRSKIDSAQVALDTGEVKDAEHEVAPWIRFKKSFSPEIAIEPKNAHWDFSSIARAKEKLVFVVNVLALEDFLARWSVDNGSLRALM